MEGLRIRSILHPRILSFVAVFLLVFTGAAALGEQPVRFKRPRNIEELGKLINAKAVLLVDAKTGYILFARNIDDRHPPASTVKLMTALIAYEQTGLKGMITVQKSDTQVEPSHVPLKVGEKVPVKDIALSVLIGSDNDSAKALGRHVAGSDKQFVALMNKRATELGCRDTKFANANGLPHKEHYISARDLMKIFQVVLQVPVLRQVCAEPFFYLKTKVGSQRVKNHNALLGKYPGMGPAKTGWTIASRHTYAAEASRGKYTLHLTLLNSKNKWIDAQLLFDYGFERLKQAEAEQAAVLASAPTAPAVKEEQLPAPSPPQTKASEVTLLPKPSATASTNSNGVQLLPKQPNTSTVTTSPPNPPPVETSSQTPSNSSPATTRTAKATTSDAPTTPGAQPETTPAAKPVMMKKYTVKRGDTLWGIGNKHGIDLNEIIAANQLVNPDKIKPGDVLLIPQL